ncbi:hypothetical protein PGT21_000597 [Puccinia graminis f. sp. tritici]|uniref:Uncharacterized protein n=1 Tax=Puccinia graminis f. sp. tritici TaxID=56615 RepID=A0A5B0NJJ0_PUCGR|nr:hypothetical protein PGT21_000597 [Puccinia graminis f. sp. tritici]
MGKHTKHTNRLSTLSRPTTDNIKNTENTCNTNSTDHIKNTNDTNTTDKTDIPTQTELNNKVRASTLQHTKLGLLGFLLHRDAQRWVNPIRRATNHAIHLVETQATLTWTRPSLTLDSTLSSRVIRSIPGTTLVIHSGKQPYDWLCLSISMIAVMSGANSDASKSTETEMGY